MKAQVTKRVAAQSGSGRVADAEDVSNSALQKAFRVLEAMVERDTALSLADIASEVGFPKTSVQRILAQLEENGLIVRDESGKRYRPGGRLNLFALKTLMASTRLSRCNAVLRKLVDQISESCNFGVLQGREVVYIDRVECPWPLRSQISAGTRAPIHCTGIGKLLLAFMPPEGSGPLIDSLDLEKRTDRTITTAAGLKRELEHIRSVGYSINDQENMVGMIALAVPVHAPDGRVVAAVALEAPVPRMNVQQAKLLLPKLKKAAAEISSAMMQDD